MYLIIIVLPLIGSIVSGFFGRKIGTSGSHLLSSCLVILSTILAIIGFIFGLFYSNTVKLSLFNWINCESINIMWDFQFDSLTFSMLIPVLIISSLVHIYSISYMSEDPHNPRFFSYLSLFTFMMIILVTASNYLLMFVGWEGVGVCSYLLVNFWYTRIAANLSSISAFLTNRVGDCFLTMGILMILLTLGDLDYGLVHSLSPYINSNIITAIGVCLLIGAMAKSAQIGLHVWLPMAMEGPTPVSALIHAATLVTAGVYLLIRSSPLLEFSTTMPIIILWLGGITTIISSLIGFAQQDLKRVIAYSTMSQLGMMIIAVGLSCHYLAIYHLINHAFYKGLLFLGAGAIIHSMSDNQDLRKYGGLMLFLPVVYSVVIIGSLSLIAIPFLSGYYSKDLIIESLYSQHSFSSMSVYIISVSGAALTTLYSAKIIYMTFMSKPNGIYNSYKKVHEGNVFMNIPLIILSLFSIFFGYISKDIYIGLGSSVFSDNSIFIHPLHETLIDTEFSLYGSLLKFLPLILTLIFMLLYILMSEFYNYKIINIKISKIIYYVYGLFNQRFFFEFIYNSYIVNIILKLGGQTTKFLDRGSIELLGPVGLEKVVFSVSKLITSLNKGVVTNYALYLVICAILYFITQSLYVYFLQLFFIITYLYIMIFSIKKKPHPNSLMV